MSLSSSAYLLFPGARNGIRILQCFGRDFLFRGLIGRRGKMMSFSLQLLKWYDGTIVNWDGKFIVIIIVHRSLITNWISPLRVSMRENSIVPSTEMEWDWEKDLLWTHCEPNLWSTPSAYPPPWDERGCEWWTWLLGRTRASLSAQINQRLNHESDNNEIDLGGWAKSVWFF